MDRKGFRILMYTLADCWNGRDARKAADCFAENARYTEPPDRQSYAGRQALYEFFGGVEPRPMQMAWHHLVFDQEDQIGVGEYTFTGRRTFHGLVIVRVVDGLIANWREYQYESELSWEMFTASNAF